MDPDTAIALIACVLALAAFGAGIFLAMRRRWLLAAIPVAAGIAAAIAAYFFLTPMSRLF